MKHRQLPLSGLVFSTVKPTKLKKNMRFTYLVTPWSRVLLEKLTGFQLVKKFPVF